MLWTLCGLVAPALGAADVGGLPPAAGAPAPAWKFSSGATGKLLDFDIPAQPLAFALDRYAAVSRRSVVFRDELVAGRISSPVQGSFSARSALGALLAGTGLVADDAAGGRIDAFVLKAAAAPPTATVLASLDRHYDGLVQGRVWEALCADSRTAPGSYRAVLRFRVDDAGRIQQARLLVPTGEGQRDAAMLAALAALQIDRSPPADLAQPMTLAILPGQAMAGHPDCQAVH